MVKTAGLGTRLAPFTSTTPKPLLPLRGIPILQFVADWIVSQGASDVLCNVHHLPEKFTTGASQVEWGKCALRFSDETAEILGSAGGIRQALPLLRSDPFLMCNADVICSFDLQDLFSKHAFLKSKHGVLLTLALMPFESVGESYPEILVSDDRVQGIGKKTAEGFLYTGVAVCDQQAFSRLPAGVPSDLIRDVFPDLLSSGRIGCHKVGGVWADIGTPRLWRDAHFLTLPREWKSRLERPSIPFQIDENEKSVRYGTPPFPHHWRGPGIGFGQDWVKI